MLQSRLIFPVLVMLFALSCAPADKPVNDTLVTGQTETPSGIKYTVDQNQSLINWRGSVLNVLSHEGTLNFLSGEFIIRDGKISQGEFVVDMATITPTDENYNASEGKTPQMLIEHLSSPDFFDVPNHPHATLSIKDGVAKLNIRGVSNVVEISRLTTDNVADGVLKASAQLTFDRQDFGVSFDTGAKDVVISDKVALLVQILATKN